MMSWTGSGRETGAANGGHRRRFSFVGRLVCPCLNAGAWTIEDLRHACGSTPKTGDAGIMHRIGLPAVRDTRVDQRE